MEQRVKMRKGKVRIQYRGWFEFAPLASLFSRSAWSTLEDSSLLIYLRGIAGNRRIDPPICRPGIICPLCLHLSLFHRIDPLTAKFNTWIRRGACVCVCVCVRFVSLSLSFSLWTFHREKRAEFRLRNKGNTEDRKANTGRGYYAPRYFLSFFWLPVLPKNEPFVVDIKGKISVCESLANVY